MITVENDFIQGGTVEQKGHGMTETSVYTRGNYGDSDSMG